MTQKTKKPAKPVAFHQKLYSILKESSNLSTVKIMPERILALCSGVTVPGNQHKKMKQMFADCVDLFPLYRNKTGENLKRRFNNVMDKQSQKTYKGVPFHDRLFQILGYSARKYNHTRFSPEEILIITRNLVILGNQHREMKELFSVLVDSYESYQDEKATKAKEEFNTLMNIQSKIAFQQAKATTSKAA